jgi:RND family efflux transporter MFP subunit
MQKIGLVLLVLAGIAVIGAAGYFGFYSAPGNTAPTIQAPQTVAVTTCDVEQTVTAPGLLVNTSETQVLMPVDGRLSEVLVKAGDKVSAGQALAKLNDYTLAEAQAEKALADAEIALKTAQDKYDSMTFPRASDELTQNTQAKIDLAKKQVAIMADRYRKVQNKLDGNLIKAQALLDLTNAQINLNNLTAQYNWYTGIYTRLDIDQAKSALALAKAQLADAQAVLGHLGIQVPFSGVVIEVNAVAAQPFHKNDPLFKIIDPKALEVKANVTEEDYPLLAPGMQTELFFDARADVTVKGKVERIVPKRIAGDRPLYNIYISLDEVPDGLAEGMTSDAAVTIAKRTGVLCLPRAVVRASSGSKAAIKVWTGLQTETRQVEIGLRGDAYVEILSGLKKGEQVVTK